MVSVRGSGERLSDEEKKLKRGHIWCTDTQTRREVLSAEPLRIQTSEARKTLCAFTIMHLRMAEAQSRVAEAAELKRQQREWGSHYERMAREVREYREREKN